MTSDQEIRRSVRRRYGERATVGGSCCGERSSCPTGPASPSCRSGYSEEDLERIPEGADLGLGCGHPTALADLRPGEVVLDLGSGAGIDCFLASHALGDLGRVIGVDMTPEMLDRARALAAREHIENVEFRLGEIEHLPVADRSVDVVISNCVVNLSPDKPQVFREAFRALRPGGRMLVSDIVLLQEIPDSIRESIDAYVGCVAGASKINEYLSAISDAGFDDVEILRSTAAPESRPAAGTPRLRVDGQEIAPSEIGLSDDDAFGLASAVSSITVRARRPLDVEYATRSGQLSP